jgi:N-acetylmuramoyl-L-alanine amidase
MLCKIFSILIMDIVYYFIDRMRYCSKNIILIIFKNSISIPKQITQLSLFKQKITMTQFQITQKYSSNAYDERIKILVLHYTAQDFETSLELLQNDVSSHYLISDQPVQIFQLVNENNRAWHAGESFWGGRVSLNDSSIGIEIVNLDGNKHQYLNQQIEAVEFLCKEIIARYNILPQNVVGHSDIAPLRKNDPGLLFPWRKLYKAGIGAMAELEEVLQLEKELAFPTPAELQKCLAIYGYKIDVTSNFDEQTKFVLDAFRRHFCPDLVGHKFDMRSYSTLVALIKKYKTPSHSIIKK